MGCSSSRTEQCSNDCHWFVYPFILIFLILSSRSLSTCISGDDVAVPRSQGALTGRRGLAGTALVYKIAGALAAKGANLDEVEYIAKMVAENCATIGMGLEHCHVAGTANPEKGYLGADEAELGMGKSHKYFSKLE